MSHSGGIYIVVSRGAGLIDIPRSNRAKERKV